MKYKTVQKLKDNMLLSCKSIVQQQNIIEKRSILEAAAPY